MLKGLFEILVIVGIGWGLWHFHGVWTTGSKSPASKVLPGGSADGSGENAPVVVADEETVLVKKVAPSPPAKGIIADPDAARFSEGDIETVRKIQAHFATGDYGTTLKLADTASMDSAYSEAFQEWLLAQMPVILTSAGWARLKLGDCDSAIVTLRRAEVMIRNPETVKGLAYCFHKLKYFGAASDEFAFYLEKRPEDKDMTVLYVDVLESEGRFDDALKILEGMTNNDKLMKSLSREDKTALGDRLQSMAERANESQHQLLETSQYFQLRYRADEHEDLVSGVLDILETALDEYVDAQAFSTPRGIVEVLLYPSANFKNIVVGGPAWAEGIYDGRVRIPVPEKSSGADDATPLRQVLRHELVHALLALMTDNRPIPPWFNEGVAQRLDCLPRCSRFVFPATPGKFLEKNAFGTPYVSFAASKAALVYKQSLYLIYNLENRYGEDALRRIIRDLNAASGLTSDELLSPFGTSFVELHEYSRRNWQARREFP